jgi:cytochrome c-type biogenesis protein CcmH
VRRGLAVVLCLAAALTVASPAAAAQPDWTVAGIEQELMCVVCHQRLDQSNSAFADGMRATLQTWHRQGLTKQQVLDRMVAQFGEEVLAAPPKEGFNLLAWVVPGAVLLIGGAVALALAAMWGRSRPPGRGTAAGGDELDTDMEARIDRDLAVEE